MEHMYIPTVAFTVGSVMGRLAGAPLSEKIRFHCCGTSGSSAADSMDAYFYRKGNIFYLCNVNSDDNSILALSCAKNGNLNTKTILVPGNCEYDVTDFFFDCAKKHIDALLLTASTLANYKKMADPQDMCLALSASGRNIRVNGGFHQISDYIKIYIGENFAMIDSAKKTLVRIPFLSIEGNITVTLENISGREGETSLQVPFPGVFQTDQLVDVSMLCKIGGFADLSQ